MQPKPAPVGTASQVKDSFGRSLGARQRFEWGLALRVYARCSTMCSRPEPASRPGVGSGLSALSHWTVRLTSNTSMFRSPGPQPSRR